MYDKKRIEYWNHFVELFFVEKIGGGSIVTGPRLRRVKGKVMSDDHFWFDVINRHGGADRTPDQMREDDLGNYQHCLGNFWGMLNSIIGGHDDQN